MQIVGFSHEAAQIFRPKKVLFLFFKSWFSIPVNNFLDMLGIQNFQSIAIFCDCTAWFVSDLFGNHIVGFPHEAVHMLAVLSCFHMFT